MKVSELNRPGFPELARVRRQTAPAREPGEPCCSNPTVGGTSGSGSESRGPLTWDALKANADRRHRIPRQRFEVTNWREYDASLRGRGSLMVWFTAEAIASWKAEPRTTWGGQPTYSGLAILTALTLRSVFRLALRQIEELIGSVMGLLGLDLAVPDHSMLSRRTATVEVPRPRACPGAGPLHLLVDSTGLKLCGAGEWLHEKHGTRVRRSWRKLPPAWTPARGASSPRC